MTRDQIIRLAQESEMGFDMTTPSVIAELERFAALVAAAEREACAQVCDAVQKQNEDVVAWLWEAKHCAEAIRARGQE